MAEVEARAESRTGGVALWKYPLLVCSLALGMLATLGGFGLVRYGSLARVLAVARGDRLLVDQPLRSVEGVRPGAQVTMNYAVTNASDRPITLVGMNSSCSCTMVEDLPITLAASETRQISARVTTSEGLSELDGSVVLFTDDPRTPEIGLGYKVRFTPLPGHVDSKQAREKRGG